MSKARSPRELASMTMGTRENSRACAGPAASRLAARSRARAMVHPCAGDGGALSRGRGSWEAPCRGRPRSPRLRAAWRAHEPGGGAHFPKRGRVRLWFWPRSSGLSSAPVRRHSDAVTFHDSDASDGARALPRARHVRSSGPARLLRASCFCSEPSATPPLPPPIAWWIPRSAVSKVFGLR